MDKDLNLRSKIYVAYISDIQFKNGHATVHLFI
jgi:hypothetical protein